MEREFLDAGEAARLLRVSKKTLKKMRISGKGPRYYKIGSSKRGKILYRRADIMEWLGDSKGSTSESATTPLKTV
jgi:hypothetical protein